MIVISDPIESNGRWLVTVTDTANEANNYTVAYPSQAAADSAAAALRIRYADQ